MTPAPSGEDATATSWEAYNDFLLHGTVDRVSKILARYELFKRVISLPGDVVEGGVLKGVGVLYWAKLIQLFNPLSERKVVGFDTFEGFPKDLTFAHDRQAGERLGLDANYTPVSPEEILGIAERVGLAHRVELVKGDATRTIPEHLERHPGFRVALLNLDFDAYDPTVVALERLYPRVVPGGVVLFDDYGIREYGESDAVDRFFQGTPAVYQALPWALSPRAYLIKPGPAGESGVRDVTAVEPRSD